MNLKLFSKKTVFCDNCILYILLLISSILVLSGKITNTMDLDEVWNYQFARRILYGQVPFRDFIMLPLPFSAQLNGWLLSIFGDELIIMRWAAIVTAAINGLLAFKFLRLTGKSYIMSFLYTAFFLSPFLLYPKNNYNWYAVLFLSAALLLEVYKIYGREERQLGYELIIGMVLGFTTIIKQNIGIAGLLVSMLILVGFSRDLGKGYLIKAAGLKLSGWVLVLGIEIIYLSHNVGFLWLFKNVFMSLTQFIGYASVSYSNLFSEGLASIIFAICIPLVILIALIKGAYSPNSAKKKVTMTTALYSFAGLVVIYPIPDWLHLIYCTPMVILTISTMFNNSVTDEKKEKRLLTIILIFIIVLCAVFRLTNDRREDIGPQINHYHSIYIPLEQKNQIIDLDQFILNQETGGRTIYFLNYQAAYYLIPIDHFAYKYDDIVGKGSLAEREIIDQLVLSDNISVIIRGINGDKNWQETDRIEEYAREIMLYRTTINGFDVFED